MAIVPRKRKKSTTYYVVFAWKGRPVWERSGTDRRAAETLETKRKREVREETYAPADGAARSTTVGRYSVQWSEGRKNRTASDDKQRLRDHVASKEWFASLRLDDVKRRHIRQLVDELVASGMPGKTVTNVYGAARTMFRDALMAELITVNPCVLPRNYIKQTQRKERHPYTKAEAVALMGPRVDRDRAVFCALGFYTGMREGEICGRRFRDWDREAAPLGCLSIDSQYGDEPLKTDEPRKAPVHPELAAILAAWWSEGFELFHRRKPTQDDFIVPMRANRANHRGAKPHHTKSSAYKMFRAACVQAGVGNRSLHSTRHSMITWARRGGARKEILETITHNAKGDTVDQYTHFDWLPRCEAVLCLQYVDAHQELHRPSKTPSNSGSNGPTEEDLKSADTRENVPNGQQSSGFDSRRLHHDDTGLEAPEKKLQAGRQTGRRRSAVRRALLEGVAIASADGPEDERRAAVLGRLTYVARALGFLGAGPRKTSPAPSGAGEPRKAGGAS